MLFFLFLVHIHNSLHFNLGTRETRLLNSRGFVNLPIYYISLLYFVAFVYHYTSFMFHFLVKNWCTLIRQISPLILISPPTALYSFIYLEIVILITSPYLHFNYKIGLKTFFLIFLIHFYYNFMNIETKFTNFFWDYELIKAVKILTTSKILQTRYIATSNQYKC